MRKSEKLNEALANEEKYGVDPDDTMVLTDDEWLASKGRMGESVYEDDVVHQIEDLKNRLIEIDRELTELTNEIEDNEERIKSLRNYVMVSELRSDNTYNRQRSETLKTEYKKIVEELRLLEEEYYGFGSR